MLFGSSIREYRARLQAFDKRYVAQWNNWIEASDIQREQMFGPVLRSWQGCRPNRMRRSKAEGVHPPPFLEDLVSMAGDALKTLRPATLGTSAFLSKRNQNALIDLWDIFENLSYAGNCRNGKAGVVGISKATMLLTNGSIGPAFDSFVKNNLEIKAILSAAEWIDALSIASEDVAKFERYHGRGLPLLAPPKFGSLATGRLYDMALGPQ
jgi:hypothetical protein